MRKKIYPLFILFVFLSLVSTTSAQDLTQEKVKSSSDIVSDFSSSNIHQSALIPISSNVRVAPPSNDDCADAVSLTVGDPCIAGTTIDGSIETGESTTCNVSPDQSVWYSFVATDPEMYVTVDMTASSGCFLGSTVFSGSCASNTPLNCEDISGGPLMNIHNLSGLTVNDTYLIRVIYNTGLGGCGGGPPGSRGAEFCILVDETIDCSACNGPCGPACGFPTTPTVAQVVANCPEYELKAPLNANQSNTYCYTFTANNTTVTMGMIASTRGCSGGTVYGATWELQESGCSGVLQSGNLSNTTMTGLTINQTYTYCYTPTAACLRLAQYPYFVGAAPLPIELVSFSSETMKNLVLVSWVTASELNNEWFELEKSYDGINFDIVYRIPGSLNSQEFKEYYFEDYILKAGTAYYRLKQIDLDGKFTYSDIIAAHIERENKFEIYPNPSDGIFSLEYVSDSFEEQITLEVYNSTAELVESKIIPLSEGLNTTDIDLEYLDKGVYFIRVIGMEELFSEKLIILD